MVKFVLFYIYNHDVTLTLCINWTVFLHKSRDEWSLLSAIGIHLTLTLNPHPNPNLTLTLHPTLTLNPNPNPNPNPIGNIYVIYVK